MLRDLSAKSWQWYDRVYEAALEHYRMYQEADPLKRGQIRPDLPSDLQNPVFARLEARAVSMLLNSVPESVSSQALATRSLSSVGIIYQVLKQFQPGGLMERQELLKSLTELQMAGSGQEAVLTLQAWFRHVARARTMQVQLPDGSILLAALDNLSKGLLGQHAHVAFRLNLSRHQLKLDYKAELETVEEYARSLLAEFEVLALSSGDLNPAKRQRVRKLKEQEVPPAPKEDSGQPPKGAGKGRPPNTEAKAAERPPRVTGKVCTNWMSAGGCQYGDKCKFIHNVDDEAMKGGVSFAVRKITGPMLVPSRLLPSLKHVPIARECRRRARALRVLVRESLPQKHKWAQR